MFTIGEFSRITGLTVKTLRLYHEKEILVPRMVDQWTNYRYYDQSNIDEARGIRYLRDLQMPLGDIKKIMESHRDDSELLDLLLEHKEQIHRRLEELRQVTLSVDVVISREKEAMEILNSQRQEIEEKALGDLLIAGIRWTGEYGKTGEVFSKLFRRTRSCATGKPFNLYYDKRYVVDGADIETCVQLSKDPGGVEGVRVRKLAGGQAVSLLFQGPYDQIGSAYGKLSSYARRRGFEIIRPTREVYLKGPGVIFRGNPRKYLTEIQFLVKEVKGGKDRFQEES